MRKLFAITAFFGVFNGFIAEKLQIEPEEVFKTFIAIDLGTTNSRVAVFKDGRVEIIANDKGSRTTPSLVGFSPEGEVLIGDSVKNLMFTNPENTVFNSKRLMGREWTDPSLQNDLKYLPYTVKDMNGKPLIEVTTVPRVEFSNPQKIAAILLMEMKDIAEEYLKKKVSHAIVTVPAYFNNAQRLATREAAIMAGFNIKIVNEPSMVAIAYGFGKPYRVEKNIVVLHLGGGAFDVSIVHVSNDIIEVISTIGDSHLGGEDFNQRVMDHLVEVHEKNTGKDMRTDKSAIQKLRHEVEKAKRTLSTDHEVDIEIESLYDGDDFSATLTREKLEELNMDLFESIMKLVEKVFEGGKLEKGDIDDIVLVGGSTRIPKIKELIKEFFNGKEPFGEMDPEEAVCYGAAVSAGRIGVEEDAGGFIVLDVNPFTVGVKTAKGTMTTIFHKNQMIPAYNSFTFTTSKDNQDVITIPVFEGELPVAEENNLLGVFNLTGFPPAPRGSTRIKVKFEIDINGIFSVSNEDNAQTGKERIASTDERSEPIQEDTEHLTKSAKMVAKEQMEARNELELHMYFLKKYIGDKEMLGGKLSDIDKTAIESMLIEKMKWLDANPDAKAEESVQQLKGIEEIVKPILAKLHSSIASRVQTVEDGVHPDSFRDEL